MFVLLCIYLLISVQKYKFDCNCVQKALLGLWICGIYMWNVLHPALLCPLVLLVGSQLNFWQQQLE